MNLINERLKDPYVVGFISPCSISTEKSFRDFGNRNCLRKDTFPTPALSDEEDEKAELKTRNLTVSIHVC